MTREAAIRAEAYFDAGGFKADLARRVAIPTESQNPERAGELARYLDEEMQPALEALGFSCRILDPPKAQGAVPVRRAHRGPGAADRARLRPWRRHPRAGGRLEARACRHGRSPRRDGRWYGRGVADNKGQHTINIAALGAVLKTRGRLGFNAKWLIEMGEEIGSPGLRELCARATRRCSRPTC